MRRPSLDNPSLFINRDLSWLAFNRRVLEEAEDERNPLLERVKFLGITASNLDEFFEVRVASLLQKIEDGLTESGPDGISPARLRELIAAETHEFVDRQYLCWNQTLLPTLADHGVCVLELDHLDAASERFITTYCEREVDPLLTPVTVDPAHPFPRVINKALCLAFLLKRRRRASGTYMGVVTVPRVLPRLVRLPSAGSRHDYIFLADLLRQHAANMYRGYEVLAAASFRVTRNSNLYLQEEESRNLLETVRMEMHNRHKGDAVRLEIDAGADAEIVDRLRRNFDLDEWQIFRNQGPVNLLRMFNLYELTPRPDLKFKTFIPRELHLTAKSQDIFDELRQHDVLLHHPYDSYDDVVNFLEGAAEDPRVVSIKQTIYRTSSDSPIGQALIDTAQDKEVTVVVELKARFDEASNIRWARNLEDAGVQVFHGLVGLKTHCKLALVVRRDADGVMRRYAHLGTGNYNPLTSRFYTDLSLLTSDADITTAVHDVFNFLTAYAERPDYEPLLLAPLDLAEKTIQLIAREAAHARQGKPARIIAKMNSLLDKSAIQELYRASQAGVQIDLIVRGVCALRPGVKSVSENIRVRSIVGRFLEHSRVFFFENGGNEQVYLGSADWMPRNFYERVEVTYPVKDPLLRQRLKDELLATYLADNTKARLMQRNGRYARVRRTPGTPEVNAQELLIALSEGKSPASAGLRQAEAAVAKLDRRQVRRTETVRKKTRNGNRMTGSD
jgi:polyphosphate kinase